jgi:hypothetical protein
MYKNGHVVDSPPVSPGPEKEVRIHDDNESLVAEPPTLPAAPLYRCPPFPSNDHPVFCPTRESIPLRLNFALYPVTRFSDEFWKKMWGQMVLVLDSYLVTPERRSTSTTTFFHPETEFIGIKYRLKIDCEKCHQPLVFRRGDIVDMSGTNSPSSRYVVETCQLIRGGFALPVHYRNFHGQGFTDTRDPCHPSFILQIPQSFCKSPLIPHLQALPLSTSGNSCPFSCPSPIMDASSSLANKEPTETLGDFLYMMDEYPAKKRSYFCIC